MRPQSITNRQCLSMAESISVFKTTPETDICLNCNIPAKKCNGDCKRYREEMKKLRKKGKI